MELVCPQCGATNRDDSVDFPFCTHCHELLVKCGYCAHFDAAAGVCRTAKSRGRRVSSDDGVDCPHYRSILLSTVAFTQRVIAPGKWVLAVAAILFALIAVGTMIQPQSPAATSSNSVRPVRVRAWWERSVKVGEPFEIDFTVANVDERASSGAVRLAIPAAFLDRFEVLSVEPTPSNPPDLFGVPPEESAVTPEGVAMYLLGARPDKRYWHYYYFKSVSPQGQRKIKFQLVTKRDFVEIGFPFQEGPGVELLLEKVPGGESLNPKYAYDLTGVKNSDALKGLGVHVYNYRSDEKGIFKAPEVFKVTVED
ncbi:hypothetical protein AMK68_05525 [candidate division KD3-62 bacterium DG_56]|uniref:Uncharacterized protein n=1 Tax=candidate division KD3-62 bacterium DG_56 TaxID=1704032 RepID=A0A0S7XHK6_9BACT|nr:MAG: hypothetical protein AMK68_05525 [candidate division KD3-62 bacterium DG_56]